MKRVVMRDGVPMVTMWALQTSKAGAWVTTQLFVAEQYAAAKAAKLGAGWRVEPVEREWLD